MRQTRWAATAPGMFTPFMIRFAIHDARSKPAPGQRMASSLAESWTVSPDGTVDGFALRRGAEFRNGDPVTAADVTLSFERYRGAAASIPTPRVPSVEIVDPDHACTAPYEDLRRDGT